MTKSDLVLLLAQLGSAVAATVAGLLGCSREAASVALLRLYRQGLAFRFRDGHQIVYQLSPRGARRAEYFAARRLAFASPAPTVSCSVCGAVWPLGASGTVHSFCGGIFR